MSGTSFAPGEGGAADGAVAGLRTANAQLRELLGEKDARIAALEEQVAGLQAQLADQGAAGRDHAADRSPLGVYLWHAQVLSRDRACAALGEMSGCVPAPAAMTAMASKLAGAVSPAVDAITKAPAAPEVAHFDETGFRTAGKLAWVHSASSGKYVLVTVHAKRGKEGMNAAGAFGSLQTPSTAWRRPDPIALTNCS